MDWKKKTYIICSIVGLVSGILTARLMINESEKKDEKPSFDLKKGAKIGLTLLDTIRKIG